MTSLRVAKTAAIVSSDVPASCWFPAGNFCTRSRMAYFPIMMGISYLKLKHWGLAWVHKKYNSMLDICCLCANYLWAPCFAGQWQDFWGQWPQHKPLCPLPSAVVRPGWEGLSPCAPRLEYLRTNKEACDSSHFVNIGSVAGILLGFSSW